RTEDAGRVEPVTAVPVDRALGPDEGYGMEIADEPVLRDRNVSAGWLHWDLPTTWDTRSRTSSGGRADEAAEFVAGVLLHGPARMPRRCLDHVGHRVAALTLLPREELGEGVGEEGRD